MNKTCIIAEAGVNHNGSAKKAIELIDLASECGADVIKFQSFDADSITAKTTNTADYQKETTGGETSQWKMLKELELSPIDHETLFERAKKRNIEFLSSPFALKYVKLLDDLGVKRFKIPSGEITNGPLLLEIAKTGKPAILSTGMASLGEIELALGVLAFGYSGTWKSASKPSQADFKKAYNSQLNCLKDKVILLHCTSQYPAPPESINLNVMKTLSSCFGLEIGLSDHSEGISISLAAIALGARVIEKHFTLSKKLPGPDHRASLEPDELAELVSQARTIEKSLGSSLKLPTLEESKLTEVARKTVVASCAIKKGEYFSETNITVKRANFGISPLNYWQLLGKPATADYQQDQTISNEPF